MRHYFDEKLMRERFNKLPLPPKLLDMLTWVLEQWAGDIQVDAYELGVPTAPFEALRVCMMRLSGMINRSWHLFERHILHR